MTCTPGTIRLRFLTESYLRMRTRCTPAAEWDADISQISALYKYVLWACPA